jgi:hypothetical protein
MAPDDGLRNFAAGDGARAGAASRGCDLHEMAGGAVDGIVGIRLSISLVSALRMIWRHETAQGPTPAITAPRIEMQS